MKKSIQLILAIIIVTAIVALPALNNQAQAWVLPATQTPVPTQAPWGYHPDNSAVVNPINQPQQQETSQATRPLLYIVEYHTDGGGKNVSPWGKFGLTFTLGNNARAGTGMHARNIVITFSSTIFDPLDGNVITIWEVDENNEGNETHTHAFRVNDMSTWMYSGLITANVSYTDPAGIPYTDVFTFTITIDQVSGGAQATSTPTVSALKRPQMVVNSYETNVDPLQPGTTFKLTLNVSNSGSADARAVSLVYGGGVTISTNPEGTPEVGGVTGGSGETSNFAPIGNSNVAVLGDVAAGASLHPEQEFVVNVTTNPGAYPLKLSFVYTDPSGNRLVDDQVITLLVFSLPQLEISFYQPMEGMLSAGMGGMLPIQITNLSKKSVVLGNVTVTSTAGDLSGNTVLVGTLDPGGYFTLEPFFTPFEEGPAPLKFEIRYTDDFNQLRTYNAELSVDVMPPFEMPEPYPLLDENGNPVLDEFGNPIMIDPNNPFPDGQPTPTEPETEGFFARIWNAIKSFFGFGSGSGEQDPTVPFDGGGGF